MPRFLISFLHNAVTKGKRNFTNSGRSKLGDSIGGEMDHGEKRPFEFQLLERILNGVGCRKTGHSLDNRVGKSYQRSDLRDGSNSLETTTNA